MPTSPTFSRTSRKIAQSEQQHSSGGSASIQAPTQARSPSSRAPSTDRLRRHLLRVSDNILLRKLESHWTSFAPELGGTRHHRAWRGQPGVLAQPTSTSRRRSPPLFDAAAAARALLQRTSRRFRSPVVQGASASSVAPRHRVRRVVVRRIPSSASSSSSSSASCRPQRRATPPRLTSASRCCSSARLRAGKPGALAAPGRLRRGRGRLLIALNGWGRVRTGRSSSARAGRTSCPVHPDRDHPRDRRGERRRRVLHVGAGDHPHGGADEHCHRGARRADGPGIGGLLNVTFGNAPELIIALFALGQGLHEVVKATLVGSILGNVLLVMGASMLAGGIGRESRLRSHGGERADDDAPDRRGGGVMLARVLQLVGGDALPLPSDEIVNFGGDRRASLVGDRRPPDRRPTASAFSSR